MILKRCWKILWCLVRSLRYAVAYWTLIYRRQTTPQVAPLAACHLQDCDDDVQGHDVIDACIPERPDPDNCSGSASAIIRRPTADCSQSAN